MARISGVDLPREKRIEIALTYIYGIGRNTADEIIAATGKVMPSWLTIDAQNLKATVDAMPKREDIDLTIQENLIVELYSR